MSQDLPVTAYALLGLLTFGDELTGYELKQRADNTLRFYWVAPAMSQIYTELTRLTEHEYVEPVTTARPGSPDDGVPDHERPGRRHSGSGSTSPGWGSRRSSTPCCSACWSATRRIRSGCGAMLDEYVAELAEALRDLRQVRESLRGADAPGEAVPLPVGRRRLGTRLLRRGDAAHPAGAGPAVPKRAENAHDRTDALLVHHVARRLHGRAGRRHAVAAPAPGSQPGRRGHRRRDRSLLVGRRTFEGDDPNKGTDQEGAFGGQWHGPVVVLTRSPPDEPPADGDLTFSSDLEEAVAVARGAAGTKYVNILGAEVARGCLELGLLDEVLVLVAPVLLGDGTRLFDWPGGHEVALVRRHVSEAEGVVNLWYDVRR